MIQAEETQGEQPTSEAANETNEEASRLAGTVHDLKLPTVKKVVNERIPHMTTSLDILAVTQEQLDRCTRLWDFNQQVWFYKVESESDPTKEYEVRFTRGRGFTCTCPAGQEGFRSCSKGTCKHCRWAWAHAEALREERREQAEIERLVRQGCNRETAQRIVYANAHPFQHSEIEIERDQERCQRKPFAIPR